jgi:Rad3-related DNA helicase
MNGIFESPTGTGKTLSILAASLHWQEKEKIHVAEEKLRLQSEYEKAKKDEDSKTKTVLEEPKYPSVPKIYIASRTQKQIEQMVKELRLKTNLKPRMAILGSRDFYCVHPASSKWANKTEECMELMDNHLCSFYDNATNLANRKKFKTELWDIEDLVQVGQHSGSCPYFAAKWLAETADVVFVPYNYIIDPMVRETSGIVLNGDILIIDEAHNIETSATDAGKIELNHSEIQPAIDDLKTFHAMTKQKKDRCENILILFLQWLRKYATPVLIPRKVENDQVCKVWSGFDAASMIRQEGFQDDQLDALLSEFKDLSTFEGPIKEIRLKVHTKNLLSKIMMILVFIFKKGLASDYALALSRHYSRYPKGESEYEWRINFWCLNSGVIFRVFESS